MLHILMHEDADGYAAGYQVAKYYLNNGLKENEYKYHVMNYNKEVPLNQIEAGDKVYIVDFSIEPEKMIELLKITTDVVWIDHHISAIRKYDEWYNLFSNYTNHLSGLRVNGISGCALTWLYLNKNINELKHEEFIGIEGEFIDEIENTFNTEAPYYLRLINDWDVWNHKMEFTRPFMMALSNDLTIDKIKKLDDFAESGLTSYVTDLICDGTKYKEFRDNYAKQLRDKYGYFTTITFDNNVYSAYILNVGCANSDYFGDLIDKYDLVISWAFNGTKYVYSMYSKQDDIDCGAICRYYGVDNGGGHKGAAGFTHKDLLWTKHPTLRRRK